MQNASKYFTETKLVITVANEFLHKYFNGVILSSDQYYDKLEFMEQSEFLHAVVKLNWLLAPHTAQTKWLMQCLTCSTLDVRSYLKLCTANPAPILKMM